MLKLEVVTAHILILEEWETLFGQLHDYAFTIKSNIDNNLYHGKDLTTANDLLNDVETLLGELDTAYRSAFDAKVAELGGFLGM